MVGVGRGEGPSVIADGGPAAISLMPDIHGTGIGFLAGTRCMFTSLEVPNLKVHR